MAPNLKDDINSLNQKIQDENEINNYKLTKFQNEISKNDATCDALNQLNDDGFAYIKADFYGIEQNCKNLKELKNTYETLSKDPSPGNRYRAYTCYEWIPNERNLKKQNSTQYFQSKEYNYIDGGNIRIFDPISSTFLENHILKDVIEKDIELAKKTGIINFDETFELGLHQIRYRAHGIEPAYSSPLWLHRDDEPLVFVHLFNLSENAIGGNNLIATTPKTITHIIQLKEPLETILLTKKYYHAVTPLGSANGDPAYRDILLVTFKKMKNDI
uniref:Prolyl 4-hydroxylase alpha subunit Fe(2+) 2OG dioxygenase domain-containing protein n=1 Tax=Panagrolaimus davidi TaxID=227884 RepID=A0A914PD96_9BILA